MKIAIVSQYYAPEVIRIPDTLAHALAARGHSVRVVTGYPNYPDGKIFEGYSPKPNDVVTEGNVSVRRVRLFISHSYNPVARFVNYLTFAWSSTFAYRWVSRADVVYVYATQMTPAIGPSLWWKLFRLPFVMHIQDLWPESVTGSTMVKPGIGSRLIAGALNPWLRWLYRNARGTIAIAPTMATLLAERGVPIDRLHTIFNWAATEVNLTPRGASTTHSRVIVYAGNLGDHQGLDTVIRAASAVRGATNLRFLIVGSGVAEGRLRKLATALGAANVEFLGRLSPERMGEIHAISDFEIVSLRDLNIFRGTIPSKLQASLAHGIPVISAVGGDVSALVQENGIGLACEPENEEQLAQAFLTAARMSESERDAMGLAARAFYGSHMSIEHGVDAIETVLAQYARPHRGSSRPAPANDSPGWLS